MICMTCKLGVINIKMCSKYQGNTKKQCLMRNYQNKFKRNNLLYNHSQKNNSLNRKNIIYITYS